MRRKNTIRSEVVEGIMGAVMKIVSTVLPCFAVLALSASVAASDDSWYMGEKVVCVNNRFLDLSDAPELVEGRTYTITDIWPARRGHLGLQVAETNAKAFFHAFDERRFIPALNTAARCSPCRLASEHAPPPLIRPPEPTRNLS